MVLFDFITKCLLLETAKKTSVSRLCVLSPAVVDNIPPSKSEGHDSINLKGILTMPLETCPGSNTIEREQSRILPSVCFNRIDDTRLPSPEEEEARTAQSFNCFSPCSSSSSVKRELLCRCRVDDAPLEHERRTTRFSLSETVSGEEESDRRMRRRDAAGLGGWRAWIASFMTFISRVVS